MVKKRLLVFASGSKDGGGSGFRRLAECARGLHGDHNRLNAEIVGVVSNHDNGGVRKHASEMGVPFYHFTAGKTAGPADYRAVAEHFGAEFVALSGWILMVKGLDPRTTFNIHPAPLPQFGGKGMYGHHAHEAVVAAYQAGQVTCSAVSMHFVNSEYDRGPVFFRHFVPIQWDDTAETLGKRVNKYEHAWQAIITGLVLRGEVAWDGRKPGSLKVPRNYPFLAAPERQQETHLTAVQPHQLARLLAFQHA